MQSTAQVSAEVDRGIIDAATKVVSDMGLTLGEAIRIMIAKTARDKRLPFDADAALEEEYGDETPNALTIETMKKVLRGEELHKAKDLNDLICQLDN